MAFSRFPSLQKSQAIHNEGEEDEDVARERQRILQGATKDDVLTIEELTKVQRDSLSVPSLQMNPSVDLL